MLENTTWIDGRSFEKARSHINATVAEPKKKPNQKVEIDLKKHAYLLGAELSHGYPFIRYDGLSVTVHDYESYADGQFHVVDFVNIQFTENALKGAYLNLIEHKEAQQLENKLSKLDVQKTEDALLFSEEVCRWGRGTRVWGLLKGNYSQPQLGGLISCWLSSASNQKSYEHSICPGISIKGLGVSFASKHLRLLEPSRFAVLDSVISEGLGYAQTSKGYNLFMNNLVQLKGQHLPNWRLCDIEASIFALVRQRVRTEK
ncbi:hypothetical protein [Halorhodospira abdelmalekii]|uniref:hypothetical protein n=1 Tax=Halorhodospira abdelmalekii TaxID=421629 RepID=UPI00190538DB|nr:hypothetical protein [Halorhodospira abdelmalekii]